MLLHYATCFIIIIIITNRQQCVVTKTQQGQPYTSNRGVPQGSVLGPFLFNLSVRKLPAVPKHCKARQYADDVSLYRAGKNVQNLCKDLTEDIIKVKEFLATRGLMLNSSKTQLVVFRPKSKPLDPDVNVQIEDVTITPSAHVKYLGIVLDEHLSFGVHIAQLERKIGCKLGMFRKVRDHLTIDAKRAFYICSIQSILEYGSNSFAHCLSASLHDRVVRLSNRALRIVFCMPRLSDVSLVLARYHIIPLSVRYQFKLYVLTYRALHDLASVFVANCFCLRSNSTCTSFFFFFLYKIHISPDTGVNDGVWWWGPLSSADQRSRLHSSMDAPKGYWVGRIKLKKKTEERKWKDCIAQ